MLKDIENKMLNTTENKNAKRAEAGRKGAMALNKDPEKKRAAALKAAETMTKNNPNYFSDISKKAHENRKNKQWTK